MADRPQRTKARLHFFGKWLDRLSLQILGRKTIGQTAEIPDPSPGLRQRDADMPAPALARLAGLGHHGAERHQITGDVIEDLRRQFLRAVDAGGPPFGVVEAGCGLHQRVETAAFRPWSAMAISRERHVNDAGTDPRRVLRREAEPRQRTRAIALRKNIRTCEQLFHRIPALLALEFDKTR